MKKIATLFVAVTLLVFSCREEQMIKEDSPIEKPSVTIPEELLQALKASGARKSADGLSEEDIKITINESVLANSNYKIEDVHIYKLATPDLARRVVTVDQQFESTLPSRWVPNDARRDWNTDGDLEDIDWMSFTPFAIANGTIPTEPIYSAMYDKWETGGYCKTVDIDQNIYDFSLGNPSLIVGITGPPAEIPLADVSVVGFLPGFVFEAVLGSENVLGVAFSFTFINPDTGEPTKTTRGKDDKAYTEIWFNDSFQWTVGPEPETIDLESVILHEFGHSLNLGHFGILQAFVQEDGSFTFDYQPVNTMNALYIGESRNFLGPNDKGNYCEAWGSWPYN